MALVGSAGALHAVSAVLRQLPADLDAAVLVLNHLDPDRESRMVEILGKTSTLPVRPRRTAPRWNPEPSPWRHPAGTS